MLWFYRVRQINALQEKERKRPTAQLLAATGSAWLEFSSLLFLWGVYFTDPVVLDLKLEIEPSQDPASYLRLGHSPSHSLPPLPFAIIVTT